MMVRDTGFEPPPASLREALRARSDLTGQAPLQIGSAQSTLELLLPVAGVGFETTCFVILQDHRSMRCSRDAASLVLGEAITKINRRADVKIAGAAS